MGKANDLDYEELLVTYNKLARFVEHIDNELSIFVIFGTLFNSGIMYHFISSFLHINFLSGWHYSTFLKLFCFNSLLSLFAFTATAAMVNEASIEIATYAWTMRTSDIHSAMSLQRFQFRVAQQIYLTIWKTSPIRRGFFIKIIGVIFTYALLVDQLNPSQSAITVHLNSSASLRA
ncbi:hypothetical protein JTE90_004919 [Oedothorax gibbosus]|uniref:Uncharacterized protein n=1 Tax=Oedothorax gibbosus TaxID=931172 RepID=A0AAV6UKR5_9ARAC|nr:hypothetical protein JTE90_004919 [Oedothorax gibbosus]